MASSSTCGTAAIRRARVVLPAPEVPVTTIRISPLSAAAETRPLSTGEDVSGSCRISHKAVLKSRETGSGQIHGYHQPSQRPDPWRRRSHGPADICRVVHPGCGADRHADDRGCRRRPVHPIRCCQFAGNRGGLGYECNGDLASECRRLYRGRFGTGGFFFRRNRRLDGSRRRGRGFVGFVIGGGSVQSGAGLAAVSAAGSVRVGAVCHRDRSFLRALVHGAAKPGAQVWAACSGGAMRTNSWPCSPHQPLAGP